MSKVLPVTYSGIMRRRMDLHLKSTMAMYILLFLSVYTAFASDDIGLFFTEEPESIVAKIDVRVRLRCKTNIPVERITWYFNDVILTSDTDLSGSLRDRQKRNKEDKALIGPYIVQSDLEYQKSSFYQSELRQGSYARYSSPKKVRRKKGRKRKEKRRRKNDEFMYGSAKRYVRSAENNLKSVNAETYGIQIRDGRLLISNFSEQNVGSYFCVAHANMGAIRSNAALVQMAYISNFTYVFPETFVAKTIAVVIRCHLPESLPLAKPKWKMNNTWIEESAGPYKVLSSGSLLIQNVTSLSGSEFNCAAYNSITEEIKMTPQSTTLFLTEEIDSSSSDIIYPISNENTDVKVEVGKQLLVECVSGDLRKLIWTKDNGPLPDSAEITNVGLLFTSVKSSDGGGYACKKNDNSSKLFTYHLNVTENYDVVAKSPHLVTLADDDDVTTLKCETQSSGLEWEWFRNGNKIDDANESVLNVSVKLELSDGYYQCFAKLDNQTSYAIFRVEEPKTNDFSTLLPTSHDYFSAILDADEVSMPQIDRSNIPTDSISHTLTWSMADSDVKLFSIKYFKEPVIADDGSVIHYPWKIVNVPGELREVVLDELDPASSYVVEMVAVSNMDKRSEIEISSFGTKKDADSGTLDKTYVPYKPSLQTEKPRDGKTKTESDEENRGSKSTKVPKAPSRPVVNGISPHKVSLTWNARGNGGSPILGYKVQRKNVESKGGWETIDETIEHHYEVGNLQRGASYKFRIIAFNQFGNSQPSSASKPFPRRRKPQRLENPPYIQQATTQGETDIVILWKYDSAPVSSINGYYVFNRPTDSDNEEDYKKETVENPSATSYVIKGLEPEMQYDIKIQAFNALGNSPYSNVYIIEMPKPGNGRGVSVIDDGLPDHTERGVVHEPDRNDIARDKAYQRNTIFLVTGAVIGVILIVLLISVFCYWRRRGAQNAQSTPELKQRNGTAGGYTPGKPSNHINMTKLRTDGHMTPNDSSDSPQQYCHSPHDTRCHCSRHQSNHSSLGRDSDYPPYSLPPGVGYPGNWSPTNYPNIHSNPMHMYVDHGHPYFAHGLGRGVPVPGWPPSSWVRSNNGEFCHVIRGDARKMSSEGGPDVIGPYPVPGGHMVMRTYAGNVTTGDYDDSAHRPDNGYHSNEDGTRTSSDSQAEKSDDATTHLDDDVNSADAATSGVTTLNDVTIESHSSSSIDELEVTQPSIINSEVAPPDQVSHSQTENGVPESKIEAVENCDLNEDDENTNFLTEENVTT